MSWTAQLVCKAGSQQFGCHDGRLAFLFWVTGELSTLHHLMKVPNEPGSSLHNSLENVASWLLSPHLVDTATAIPKGSMKHIALVVW